MHAGPIQSVLLVHGYSVRSLNSWGRLPQLLQAGGLAPEAIFLSAFVSLDDYVTCNDLAAALEHQIAAMERAGLDLGTTAIICHSTGALVTRRWLLDRRAAGGKTPSHLITAAGANHGSTLAQLGRTELAHVFRHLTEQTDVGKRVLEDLDYGSTFVRTLNREWLEAWNDGGAPLWKDVYCFSMGGADHSYWQNQLVWQSREAGSDGTVRISGANLNYRFLDLAPPYEKMTPLVMTQPAPHLVAQTPDKRYSHTSQHDADTLGIVLGTVAGVASELAHLGSKPQPVSQQSFGILEGIVAPEERPFRALIEAFAVQDSDAYVKLATSWYDETNVWGAANPDEVNATIVVSIADERNAIVDDSLILIRDDQGLQSISASLLGVPIKNEVTPSVVSFYVNVPKFRAAHPHSVHIEARTDTPYVSYSLTLDGPISDDSAHSVTDNQVTYVNVRTVRDPSAALVFYSLAHPGLAAILDTNYPPFPAGSV
jgi:hypothetical protein